MELLFNDPSVKPTDDLIFSALGDYGKLWISYFDSIRKTYPDIEITWNYYKDGHNWLLKSVRKKKTLFWTAIFEDTFNVTFYFGEKSTDMIEASTIDEPLKDQFRTGKRFGKIRAISLRFFSKADVENALKLAALKDRIK